MARKANIAVFVPHNGCPHQCSFCDQRSITGKKSQPTPEDVRAAVETALSSKKEYDFEIAFFGGSFTAIDRGYMISLLDAAKPYVESGAVSGIRLSTRPDAVDEDVLNVLKRYGVTAIELGAQSMCDDVLAANLRGHTAKDAEDASRLIKSYGFSLGLQMMTGLYKSSRDKDIYTAEKIIALRPDTVRVYPTVTLKNTLLGELFTQGVYRPMPLSESVDLCAMLLEMFGRNNIEVIRLGLHYSGELIENMVYDNYHPAFRELCESRIMLDRFLEKAEREGIKAGSTVFVHINPSCVSKFNGQKRSNIIKLGELGINVKAVPDENVPPLSIGSVKTNSKEEKNNAAKIT